MTRFSWPLAIALSLLIHGGLALGLWQARSTPVQGGAQAEGSYGFDIGLGMAGSYTDAVARQKAKQRELDAEQQRKQRHEEKIRERKREQKRIREQEKKNPDHKPKPRHPSPRKHLTPARQKPITGNRKAVRRPILRRPPPAATSQVDAVHAQASDSSSQASQRATGSGSQQQVGGRPGAARDYYSTLMAWLNHHKRYPRMARKNKEQGIVKLKFTVAKNGRISNASIHTSSGQQRLDDAAMKMLREADPVPGIPDDLGRNSLTVVIPVEYSLSNDRYYR